LRTLAEPYRAQLPGFCHNAQWRRVKRCLQTVNTTLNRRRCIMTWQTPQAIDVRLGFEITMYISNR